MTDKDDQPIAREPWQRLLRHRADAPPETTDTRIRAAARRALVKRPAGWWLPASLAASFVLAFMLVQSQFGEKPAPALVTEADVAEPEPADAQEEPARDAAPDAYILPERREQRAPPGETLDRAPPPPTTEVPAAPRAESPSTGLWSGRQSQPTRAAEAELSAEQESAAAGADADANAAASEDPSEIAVTGSRKREPKLEATTAVSAIATATAARYRSPEVWYAAIEALRADGRTEEAEHELKLLEEAHPGWLKEHLAEQERQRNNDGR